MAEYLAAEFNPKGWSINTEEATTGNVMEYDANTQASREVLGLEYMPIERSWLDMANSLIETGFIQKPV